MSSVRVSIGQMCSNASIERNLAIIERFAKQAKQEASRMLFLPENACFMGVPGTKMSLDIAESLGNDSSGTMITRLKAICREQKLWMSVGGFQEQAGTNKMYNTHLIIDDHGALVCKYRKIHLFDYPEGGLRESVLTEAGDAVEVCKTPFGLNLGLSVCFDVRFPLLYKSLLDMGANVMLIPAAFTVTTGQAHWEPLLRVRAIETQSFVIAAAQSGEHNEKRSSYGNGMVVDPWGTVICRMEGEEELRTVELDLGRLAEVRRKMPLISPL